MNNLVITNNPLVKDGVKDRAVVDYRQTDAEEILDLAAKEVEKGAKLREDPNKDIKKYYKSIVLLTGGTEVDVVSKGMIDRALVTMKGIEPKKPSMEGTAKKKDLEKVVLILR
ncbi:MAG: hypothetical protein GX663_05585 [Clostridiales bacterium]|nr:hypothetical protein [Clostridiales bacterium]